MKFRSFAQCLIDIFNWVVRIAIENNIKTKAYPEYFPVIINALSRFFRLLSLIVLERSKLECLNFC